MIATEQIAPSLLNKKDIKDLNQAFFSIDFENKNKYYYKNSIKKRKTVFYIVDVLSESELAGVRSLEKRFIFRKPSSFLKLVNTHYFSRHGKLGLINRGLFVLTRNEILEYRRKGHIEIPKERRLYEGIFIDIDEKNEIYPKILVKYLSKAGIIPFCYETPNGYHLYILFEEGFYPSDGFQSYLEIILEGVKYLAQNKLNIPVDIVSYKHPVWVETIYNRIKNAASKLVFKGKRANFWHLYNFFKKYSKSYINSVLKDKIKRQSKTSYSDIFAVEEKEWVHSSHTFTFLARNKSNILLYASPGKKEMIYDFYLMYCKRPVNRDRFYTILESYIARNGARMPKNEARSTQNTKNGEKGGKKYVKYKERIDAIRTCLLEDPNMSLSQISKRTGISKSTLHNIFKICEREIIIKNKNIARMLLTKKTYHYSSPKTIDKLKRKILSKTETVFG